MIVLGSAIVYHSDSLLGYNDRNNSYEEATDLRQDFNYFVDRFADIQVLRYKVPGFEELPLAVRELTYYLYEAALSGRDIVWDQNFRHNLTIRHTLEALIHHYPGDRDTDEWRALMTYTKRIWLANGIHHHYGQTKFKPGFSSESFAAMVRATPADKLPEKAGADVEGFLKWLEPILFDESVAAKKVNKDTNTDLVQTSCVNYYDDVTQAEVDAFYEKYKDAEDKTPPSWGLNSKLVKVDGELQEHIWKADGVYGAAIEKICYWLEKAVGVAENSEQAKALQLLVDYYRSGDLATFDDYSIAWLADTNSSVDNINGFIETYNDPMDRRGTFEAIVSVKDEIATHRIETIAREAGWFEKHSPIDEAHKKENVTGISGAVINMIVGAGDANPTCPIGINLPNADWVREKHGSKSVNLANIVDAYTQIKGKILEEFAGSTEEFKRAKEHGELADNLHTDLHEVIGHGSGRLMPGVGTPKETLKNYSSTLEETRADLVALYYIPDPRLQELGLVPSEEVGRACYDDFMRNGLMLQLRRLHPGDELEEDHMRNRQLIAAWALKHSDGAMTMEMREGKSYVVIHDYDALRQCLGQLLQEVQRIKSEGDYDAGKKLVEAYGVKVNPGIHAEVLKRFASLDMAPYCGFINPVMTAEKDADGKITDVRLAYDGDFTERMLHYGKHYSFLPLDNHPA